MTEASESQCYDQRKRNIILWGNFEYQTTTDYIPSTTQNSFITTANLASSST